MKKTSVPYSLRNFKDMDKFISWLTTLGGTVVTSTNQFEVIRVKGENNKTLVLYQNKNGTLNWPDELHKAYNCFKNKQDWNSLIKVTKRKGTASIKKFLLKNHGDKCFYCLKKMPDSDITLEHLLSKADGGSNNLKNCVLTHEKCNREAGRVSVYEKVLIRENNLNGQKI